MRWLTNFFTNKSLFKTYLNDTILPLIPESVSSIIKSVTKYSYSIDTASRDVDSSMTTDLVWLPSYREVYGGTSAESIGTAYTGFFTDASSRQKCVIGSTSATRWWFRSASSQSFWHYVLESGNSNTIYGTISYGVALGFCT